MSILSPLILNQLVWNEVYTRKVLPYLDPAYFQEKSERVVFEEIQEYFSKYGKLPSIDILAIETKKRTDLSEEEFGAALEIVSEIEKDEKQEDVEWLTQETEKFARDAAVYNAIYESISIIEGGKKEKLDSLPELLSTALAVNFDPHIGHDYFSDWEERYNFYHNQEERIPFKFDIFNRITKGGVPRKTLNIVVAGTGGFKSGFLCDLASHYISLGLNVLYITNELAEEKVSERIDANLMNITVDDVYDMPRVQFESTVGKLRKNITGDLIVKEFPTGSANVNHFRALVNELKLKKKFQPDVVIVDYLNICSSTRIMQGLYEVNKKIAEELRGLAVELNVPLWTATQTNRGGQNSSDPDYEDVAESHGVSQTADFLFYLFANEELQKQGRIMVKQGKSRYDDVNKWRKFMLGVNKDKMTMYEIPMEEQKGISGGKSDPIVLTEEKERKEVSGFVFD